VVTAALGLAPQPVGGRGVLVIGAGSMGGRAMATLAGSGADPLLVANRSARRAQRLAELHGATAIDFTDLDAALHTVDLVVCATASPGAVLTAESVAAVVAGRAGRGLTIVDLAVPHDVEPAVAGLSGVTVIDMASVGAATLDRPSTKDQQAAEAIVAGEVETFLTWLRGSDVGPTVAALRARADEVVGLELRRFNGRRPELSDEQRADVAHTVHRIVQRLLHSPTVRVRQLAGTPGGDQYAAALRELFDLSVGSTTEELDRAVAVAWEEVDEA
jgi:glutamyl-tRNA reductase